MPEGERQEAARLAVPRLLGVPPDVVAAQGDIPHPKARPRAPAVVESLDEGREHEHPVTYVDVDMPAPVGQPVFVPARVTAYVRPAHLADHVTEPVVLVPAYAPRAGDFSLYRGIFAVGGEGESHPGRQPVIGVAEPRHPRYHFYGDHFRYGRGPAIFVRDHGLHRDSADLLMRQVPAGLDADPDGPGRPRRYGEVDWVHVDFVVRPGAGPDGCDRPRIARISE